VNLKQGLLGEKLRLGGNKCGGPAGRAADVQYRKEKAHWYIFMFPSRRVGDLWPPTRARWGMELALNEGRE